MTTESTALTPHPRGRYACERCGARYASSGDCAACDDEPLLDLADEDAVLMLDEMYDARRRKRFGVLSAVSAAVVIPGLLLVGFNPFSIVGMVITAGLIGVGAKTLSQVLPGAPRKVALSAAEREGLAAAKAAHRGFVLDEQAEG